MNNVLPGRFVIPDVVASHFFIKEGDKVADFGAGSGFFLKVLSEAVGDSGHVYACDIQKQLVEKLVEFIRLNSLPNVSTLWCDFEEENGIILDDNSLDLGILVNTLFQLGDKETAIREMKRVIRHGGVIHVIDWSESFGGLGPQPADVIQKDDAVALFEAEGMVMEREFPAGDHHYGFSVRKV